MGKRGTKKNRLPIGNKPTLDSLEAAIVALDLTVARVTADQCRVAPYAIPTKQIPTTQFLSTRLAGDKPLILGRHTPSGEIEVLLGGFFVREAGQREYLSVLTGNIPDALAVQIAIVVGKTFGGIDNIQLAKAYAGAIKQFHISGRELARVLGIAWSSISTRLQMLTLPDYAQYKIASGGIAFRDARVLMSLPAHERATAIMGITAKHNDVQAILKTAKASKAKTTQLKPLDSAPSSTYIEQLNTLLSTLLGTPVTVHDTGKGGSVSIACHSIEAASGVLDALLALQHTPQCTGTIQFDLPSSSAMNAFVEALIPTEDSEE